jgi:hypothetical protein
MEARPHSFVRISFISRAASCTDNCKSTDKDDGWSGKRSSRRFAQAKLTNGSNLVVRHGVGEDQSGVVQKCAVVRVLVTVHVLADDAPNKEKVNVSSPGSEQKARWMITNW